MASRAWQQDLSWSSRAFLDVVWPVIKHKASGGEIIPVEATDDSMRDALDRLAGVDAWQIVEDRGMRGLASRVQKIKPREDGTLRPFNTFTVRYRRDNGNSTEFEKRLEAVQFIDNYGRAGGWLYPILTIQGYVTEDLSRCLSAAVVYTRDLVLWVDSELRAGLDSRYSTERPYLWHNGSNATMIVCPWGALRSAGVPIGAVPRGCF